MEDFNSKEQITDTDMGYKVIEPMVEKPGDAVWTTEATMQEEFDKSRTFNKNEWLDRLAIELSVETQVLKDDDKFEYNVITIEDLQRVLQYYFPTLQLNHL